MFKKLFLAVIVVVLAYYMLRTNRKKIDPDEVKGLRVVVTGASSGIGEQISYQLAAMGARLLITARTESNLQRIVKKCKQLGSPEAYYVAVSLCSYENASLVITEAIEKFGGIDVLFLNHVGDVTFGGYQYNVKDIEASMMTNVLSHAHMASSAMETLKANNGRVILTSSLSGMFGSPYFVSYSTTKHALNGFFRSFRHELKLNNTDVSISLCHIGYIGTKKALRLQHRIKEKPSPPGECAAEIIRGGMAREEDVYYPEKASYVPILFGLFPNFINEEVRNNYIDEA